MEGLGATNTVVDLPVFVRSSALIRRKTGHCQRIGTKETSILPSEDCCTIFVSQASGNQPKVWERERSGFVAEEMKTLMDLAMETAEIIHLYYGKEWRVENYGRNGPAFRNDLFERVK